MNIIKKNEPTSSDRMWAVHSQGRNPKNLTNITLSVQSPRNNHCGGKLTKYGEDRLMDDNGETDNLSLWASFLFQYKQ
jgi:hypothetical protein